MTQHSDEDQQRLILQVSGLLDSFREWNAGQDVDWDPLHEALPMEHCDRFMWMYRVAWEGEVIEDLVTMGFSELSDLVLGWERCKDGHGNDPLTFLDGADLSEVTGPYSLKVHAIEFTDEHLGTLGSAWSLMRLALTGADLSALAPATRLASLNVAGTGADDTTLGSLRGVGWLQTLDLQCTNITDD